MKCAQWPIERNSEYIPLNGIIHKHHKNRGSDKICHPWCWWSFWHMMSKVFLSIIPFHRVRLHAHHYNSFLQYHLHHAVREEHPYLVENAIITHDNPTATQQTLAFWLGSDKTPSLFSWPWSMWLWLDFQTKSHCVGNHLQRERIFWQQFGMRWQRLACQVLPMVFAAYPITD